MIRAFVFDFDGLILDTETLMFKATNEVYKEYKSSFPISIWGRLAGTHEDEFDLYVHFIEQTGASLTKEEFYEKRDALFNEMIKDEEVLPGVRELLEAGKEAGLKIALATSSGDQWAKKHLERLGLLAYFDCIVEANDVTEVKPNPELFLKACEGVGVKPSEAIAFEDSYHGAVAAKRAGLYCVVIPNEVTRELTFEDDVDLKLLSLADTNFKLLLDTLQISLNDESKGD
ncbi:HAD family hydrolase [Pullulanibacillus sp. KACC 23026]|uniref:HAD family hydrolase n=1 Tax=Pullulanibacillus sp. KACC 23026 TaxID=3028315 RepID=UPI0023B1C7B7|nr:HAD family hydrolase [Pullulanibacillus sp. KACC 23026]WEG12152.1 HAD family hydrolase [Pullulanibacillus sp. KACC 23026]